MLAATLHTGRLDLAVPVAEDAETIFAIAGDRATVAHNPSDFLADVAEAYELVSRWIQHWQDRGFGYWCVREVGRSPVVGYCGVKAMSAHGQPVLNLVYRFSPSVWGRGYATEAAIAAVAWAEQHQPDSTILARVRPANKASQNVALKAGLRRDPAMDEQGEDGLDLAFTNRTGAIAWVRLELPVHVVLPEPPPLPPGVVLASMVDLGDGDRLRRQIYELNKDCSADIPDRGEFFTYDQYHQRRFRAEGFRADATILAVAGDELVGMCAISQRPGDSWAFIEMTGVRRSLRRLGLATALKVEAIRRVRGAGAAVVRTIHHPDNKAIINANRAIGFVDADFTLG